MFLFGTLIGYSCAGNSWSIQESASSNEWQPGFGLHKPSSFQFVNIAPPKTDHTQIVWGNGYAQRPVAISSRSFSLPSHTNFKLFSSPFVHSQGFARAGKSAHLSGSPVIPAYGLHKFGSGFGINSLPVSYSKSINKLALGINSGLSYGKSVYQFNQPIMAYPLANYPLENRNTHYQPLAPHTIIPQPGHFVSSHTNPIVLQKPEVAQVTVGPKVTEAIFPKPSSKEARDDSDEHDSVPQYSFSYGVTDKLSGDLKGQTESREGDVVKGQYSLIDADGYKRIVDYTADSIHGFQAVVRREPVVHTVPVSKIVQH